MSIPIYVHANQSLCPLGLDLGPGHVRPDFAMKVTDKNYLDTQGFSVFLYDATYHPVFMDQKNTAMEMILHGQRIATNGDDKPLPQRLAGRAGFNLEFLPSIYMGKAYQR